MSSYDRRAVARRRAWGRGPKILRFEPLEGRQLMATVGPMPDLLATQFNTVHAADWGDLIHATGTIANQGTATTIAPVTVDIYASTSPILGAPGSKGMLVGSATIPSGLAPGSSYDFDKIVPMPSSTALGALGAQTLYLALSVDPMGTVSELSKDNNVGRGVALDTSVVSIVPHQPANLVGSSIAVTPLSTSTPGVISWGDTFNVTEQIKNTGQGDAPPTRARIVLTPDGAAQGAWNDVTIGEIAVPAVAAFQSTNVVQTVTLPPIAPATLGTATQFTLSIVQDADFLTQPIYPRVAEQGPGHDQGAIGISPGPLATTPRAPQADLAPAAVVVSGNTLYWGQTFQVGAVIQNVGPAASGPFRVRFVAAGTAGDLSHGVFLGDAMVDGVAAYSSVNVLTTVRLPAKLPNGSTVASPAYARIYAIADPEDVTDQPTRSNNMASSAPVLLKLVGVDGTTTVPTYPANIYNNPEKAAQAAKAQANKGNKTTKPTFSKPGAPQPATSKPAAPKKKLDFLASVSQSFTKGVEHQLKVFPDNVSKFFKRIGVTGGS